MLSITAKSPNGIPVAAESELFRWRAGSDGMGDGYLSEIATGRAIYQMSRMFRDRMGSEPITDQVTIDAVREFWAQIRIAVEVAQATVEAAEANYNDDIRL